MIDLIFWLVGAINRAQKIPPDHSLGFRVRRIFAQISSDKIINTRAKLANLIQLIFGFISLLHCFDKTFLMKKAFEREKILFKTNWLLYLVQKLSLKPFSHFSNNNNDYRLSERPIYNVNLRRRSKAGAPAFVSHFTLMMMCRYRTENGKNGRKKIKSSSSRQTRNGKIIGKWTDKDLLDSTPEVRLRNLIFSVILFIHSRVLLLAWEMAKKGRNDGKFSA